MADDTITWECPQFNLELYFKTDKFHNIEKVQHLRQRLEAVHAAIPLIKFELIEQVTLLDFKYEMLAADTREWKQVLHFNSLDDTNPSMTFDVQPGWRLSEFKEHRDLRLLIIAWIGDFYLSKVVADFT